VFPYNKKLKKVGTVSLENTKVRKLLVAKMGLIIDVSVTDANCQLQWKCNLPKYKLAIKIAGQKEAFTDAKILKFQKAVNKWFEDYVYLTGSNGMTKYIHLLCACHLADYKNEINATFGRLESAGFFFLDNDNSKSRLPLLDQSKPLEAIIKQFLCERYPAVASMEEILCSRYFESHLTGAVVQGNLSRGGCFMLLLLSVFWKPPPTNTWFG
jgi:hypothetical protein